MTDEGWLDIASYVESSDGRFLIVELAEPAPFKCSAPDCTEVHEPTTIWLVDLACRARIPFTTFEEAQNYAETFGMRA